MPNPGTMVDPLTTHRFAVEVDGLVLGAFDECTGLAGTLDFYEYKEGGLNSYTHKLPGRISWGTITLKWGTTDSTKLWEWFKAISAAVNKSRHYRNVSIIQFKESGTEDRRWNLDAAFPVKWSGPSLNAAQGAVSIETLELACADVTLVKA
ncbi:MAG: phage tail protein [Anaerolinea sp.]|nr:phage tail protein [Anaerolinea sp.]